ncbi:GDP-mannose 4,6-dehydratase [Oscillochloris sp. ZM17-4]|uniref:NAD-dependent epimerase/dehydratase family protein n=1 Tax=Oscillochloris sp. ZM17-4 TaxID=2866714 RepID=UPI001C72DBAC|nr:GDP-mannose 4,6-dehydratase [Oscillochloris sp. ZM17-4]MBX0328978.1 GDP-mannose 4,6-dehydratase [Oscillochloris sp. ZM17-4]
MNHLITGGAGFIGCNLADALLARGEQVTIFDNLSRPRSDLNLSWLQGRHGARLRFIHADIRDSDAVMAAVPGHQTIFHLASQVAVTTSVKDPRTDFEINALGSLNVLEAARLAARPPAVFFASTNKVYGGMEDVAVVEQATRYAYRDMPEGVPESHLLDFHSPYGCSKGSADQYVRDYARIYGLKTVVFRQGCIYGPRQMGVEDQGWAAHFVIAAVTGRPVTIYGDGKQVRDMLYIDDLVAAYLAALERIGTVSGRIYNIGGGPANALSIWAEFGPLLERLTGNRIDVRRGDWRPGDQSVYISAIAKAERELGWRPQVDVAEGIARLVGWVQQHRDLFER